MRLWTAETVSQLGSQVSLLALPLVAISVLHATTFQVGALTAVEFSPFVLFGLPAGAIVDRLPRRPILIWCDIGRAVALASVPIASAIGYSVTRSSSSSSSSRLRSRCSSTSRTSRSCLRSSNAISSPTATRNSRSVTVKRTNTAVPGIGGLLVQWVGAASAVTADAVSFVASALLDPRHPHERAADHRRRRDQDPARALLGGEIREGLAYVLRSPGVANDRRAAPQRRTSSRR